MLVKNGNLAGGRLAIGGTIYQADAHGVFDIPEEVSHRIVGTPGFVVIPDETPKPASAPEAKPEVPAAIEEAPEAATEEPEPEPSPEPPKPRRRRGRPRKDQ